MTINLVTILCITIVILAFVMAYLYNMIIGFQETFLSYQQKNDDAVHQTKNIVGCVKEYLINEFKKNNEPKYKITDVVYFKYQNMFYDAKLVGIINKVYAVPIYDEIKYQYDILIINYNPFDKSEFKGISEDDIIELYKNADPKVAPEQEQEFKRVNLNPEKIFEKNARKYMLSYNHEGFKNRYKHLYKTIIESMKEVSSNKY